MLFYYLGHHVLTLIESSSDPSKIQILVSVLVLTVLLVLIAAHFTHCS